MFKTRDIYMKMCHQSKFLHVLTDEERITLQAHLRKMYVEIERVCEQHGLTVMLAYGSLLGAIRHSGFIPWDDDLDLYMPRKDYDELINKYADELPNNYIVYAPNSKHGPIYNFAKIIDKNTIFVFPGDENAKHHAGVFVDIFPLESINAKKSFSNRIKSLLSMGIIYISGSVMQYENKSKIYRQLMSGSRLACFNYWFRQSIGFFFSFINSKKWQNLFDSICHNIKETGFLHEPAGIYTWEPIPKSVFLPAKRIKFDDIEASIPNDPYTLLERDYGDWHYIPKPEERWEHFLVDIKI